MDFEDIVTARLSLIAHTDSSRARYTVNRDAVIDQTATLVAGIGLVPRNCRLFHMHAVAMVDVVQVSPPGAVLDASSDSEIRLRARWCSRNPPAPGHEIATRWRRGWWRSARDSGRRCSEYQVCACHSNDVQRIHRDIGSQTGLCHKLFIDDHDIAVHHNHLVCLAGYRDTLLIDDERTHLHLTHGRGPTR